VSTFLPSLKPSFASPTNKPNNLPVYTSTLNPTSEIPSCNPTTDIPTYIPTPLPAPILSFVNTMSVQGLPKGCASMSDNTTLATFIKSQSVIMNISESSLNYQGCVIAARRLLNENMNSRFKLQTSYDLATQVTIVLSIGNVDANAAAKAMYDQISITVSNAVKTGTFAQVMQATSKALGGNSSSVFQVTEAVSSGLQVTIYTYSPTKSPSLKPSIVSTIYPSVLPTPNPIPSVVNPAPEVQNVNQNLTIIVATAITAVVLFLMVVACLVYYVKFARPAGKSVENLKDSNNELSQIRIENDLDVETSVIDVRDGANGQVANNNNEYNNNGELNMTIDDAKAYKQSEKVGEYTNVLQKSKISFLEVT